MENSKKLLSRKAFFKLFKNANQFEIHQINSEDKESMRVDVTAYYDTSIIDIPPDITLKQLAVIVISGFQRVEERLDKVESRLDNLEKDVAVLKEDVSVLKQDVAEIKVRVGNLEKDVADIKRCPTIQKELNELKK